MQDVTKIELKPGDVLAVKLPDTYGDQSLKSVRDSLKELFPHNKSIVYTDDIEFLVIKGGKKWKQL